MQDVFDVVIPFHVKDFPTLEACVQGCSHLKPRTIYLIGRKDPVIKDTTFVNEETFPYRGRIVHHLGKARAGWYFQQFIKLFAWKYLPLDRYLVVDADTVFMRPVSFFEAKLERSEEAKLEQKGKTLFCAASEYHPPYFAHLAKLHPTFGRSITRSGICHHMMFDVKILKEIFELISSHHKMEPEEVLLTTIDPKQGSGMAEYELYFHYMHKFHPDEMKIRELKWKSSSSFDLLSQDQKEYDYVSYHSWLRSPRENLLEICKILTPHVLTDQPFELIRLGSKNDGGYLVEKNLLSEIDTCLTLGVGGNIDFERDLHRLYPEITCHLFDHTINKWWSDPGLEFHPYGIGEGDRLKNLEEIIRSIDDGKSSKVPRDKEEEQSDPERKRTLPGRRKLLLKIDVEGAEWGALDALHDYESSISQLTIELHWFEKNNRWAEYLETLEIIHRYFICVWVHGNNNGTLLSYPQSLISNSNSPPTLTALLTSGSPLLRQSLLTAGMIYSKSLSSNGQDPIRIPNVIEATFINRRLISSARVSNELCPISLDAPNHSGRPEMMFGWWVAPREPGQVSQPPSFGSVVFSNIYKRNVWGKGSGGGSTLENTESYRVWLRKWLTENKIRSVTDLGCGDWQFSSHIDWTGIKYLGLDCVEDLIKHHNKTYAKEQDKGGIAFDYLDVLAPDFEEKKLPESDLIILKDVIQHWPTNEIIRVLPLIRRRCKYLLLINCSHQQHDNEDCPLGGFRALNYRMSPLKTFQPELIFSYSGGGPKHVLLVKGEGS